MATGTLTPDTGPAFVLPFGWDGTNFKGLRADITGVIVPALRTSLLWDRGATTPDVVAYVSAASHALTLRGTYTVPAGRFALLSSVYMELDTVPVAAIAWVEITVRGVYAATLRVRPTTSLDLIVRHIGYNILLMPGNVVSIYTYNGSVTTILFIATCFVLEFAR